MDFQFDFGALESDFSESESESESEPETQNDSQESDSEEEFEDSDFQLEDGQPFREIDEDLYNSLDRLRINDKPFDPSKVDTIVGSFDLDLQALFTVNKFLQ